MKKKDNKQAMMYQKDHVPNKEHSSIFASQEEDVITVYQDTISDLPVKRSNGKSLNDQLMVFVITILITSLLGIVLCGVIYGIDISVLVQKSVLAIVALIAAYASPHFSLVFGYSLIVMVTVMESFPKDNLIIHVLLGTFICLMANSLTKFRHFIYALMLVCSLNVTLLFVSNNFELEKVFSNSLDQMLLTNLSVLIVVYLAKRLMPMNPKSPILAAIATDASLLVQMKTESEKLYHHSMVIADLSRRAALFMGADAVLACAGGWYHEIGRLTGKDYVLHGVALIQEHGLPSEIADIIIQHSLKEQLPQTLEAAIVMLTDNIVTTIQYMKNQEGNQIIPEKVVENTFLLRMNKGVLNETNITISEFTKLKQFYLNVVSELS